MSVTIRDQLNIYEFSFLSTKSCVNLECAVQIRHKLENLTVSEKLKGKREGD